VPSTFSRAGLVAGALAGLLAACGGGSSGTDPTPVPTPTPEPTPSAALARYRVTFDATWSAATHPVEFPANPHFSPLIGGTHSDRATFWEPGGLASAGIEAMAEQGQTSPLDAEIEAAIAAGTAQGLIRAGGINPSPGSVSVEFQIGREQPHVTLVSMIAPSPDWFVGVHGLSLIENGDWVDEKTVSLAPYDAGTDDGSTYRSANSDTSPREPIRELEGPPVASGGMVTPFGTFIFVRLLN
jgi:hypothetical protein